MDITSNSKVRCSWSATAATIVVLSIVGTAHPAAAVLPVIASISFPRNNMAAKTLKPGFCTTVLLGEPVRPLKPAVDLCPLCGSLPRPVLASLALGPCLRSCCSREQGRLNMPLIAITPMRLGFAVLLPGSVLE